VTGWRWTTPGALNSADGALAVHRLAERVDHAAQELRAHGDVEHAAGAARLVALLDGGPVAHDDRADVVLFQVERQRRDHLPALARGDLEHLARHGPAQAVDAGDPVLDLEHLTDLLGLQHVLVPLDLAEEDVLDLARAKLGIDRHLSILFPVQRRRWSGRC
jgi:hypothetical protein